MREIKDFDTEKNIFIGKVLNHIHHRKLHKRIYEEISNHLDDMYEDFNQDFDNEAVIVEKIFNEMGDPNELGKEMKIVHSKTLRRVKVLKATAIILVITFVISISGFFESKDIAETSKVYYLPKEAVKLERSLITYTELEEYSILNDICWYTNIDWHNWGTTQPIYKVKEYNLFNDYYVLNENQSVILDFTYAIHGSGKIYIDDISKLPKNYHSDKLSKAVIYKYSPYDENDWELCLDLTPSEVTEFEKLTTCLDDNEYELYDIEEKLISDENFIQKWSIQFHIKDLEGLYYYADCELYKTTDGKYYVGEGINRVHTEVPEYIAVKIDKAFKDTGVTF